MADYINVSVDRAKTGENIRRLRKAAKLTVSDVCEALGVARDNTIYDWERGDELLSLSHAVQLSRLFNTTLDSIIVLGDDDAVPVFMGFLIFHGNTVWNNEGIYDIITV